MRCEDFDKLIHLYFDGELDAGKSKEIEEHLLTCQRCAAKLQELKKLEESAKGIRMPELSPDYWKTFAERVRNEIILRRRKSIWARLKSGWESFFFYSPVKLRIAAGIASILLVFIIGRLYWNYRGKELEKIRSEKVEKVLIPQTQKKVEALAPAVKESLQVEKQPKELILSKPKTVRPEGKTSEVPAPQESVSTISKEKIQEKKIEETTQGILKTQVGFVTKESVSDSLHLHVRGGRAGEVSNIVSSPESVSVALAKPKTVSETTLYVQKLPEEKLTGATTLRATTAAKKDEGLYPAESIRYYKVDTNWVRALTEKDTLVEADTLKKVISTWKEYFEKKPALEWAPEGFSQVKIAYELLFLKTNDESLRQEGVKLLKQYQDSVTDQKTKDELTKNIFKLEALKKK